MCPYHLTQMLIWWTVVIHPMKLQSPHHSAASSLKRMTLTVRYVNVTWGSSKNYQTRTWICKAGSCVTQRKDFKKDIMYACAVTVIRNWASHFTYDCSTELLSGINVFFSCTHHVPCCRPWSWSHLECSYWDQWKRSTLETTLGEHCSYFVIW